MFSKRNFKKIFLFLTLFWCISSLANDLTVTVEPTTPILGESFYLHFKVKGISEDEPLISFTPIGADVVRRSNQGVSIRSVYLNGRLVTTRESTYVYELMPANSGRVRITDIKVELNGKILVHESIDVNILKEAKKNPAFFVIALTDKSSVYVNEGFSVKYYLYRKINIVGDDVEAYPKLEDFLKRFQEPSQNGERVTYNGDIYIRKELYGARLFSNKAGRVKVDSLSHRVQYIDDNGRSINPFGLGFNMRNVKTKVVKSDHVPIEVKPLPAHNVPKHFTGLVGPHQFTLTINKDRFLVNEVIEVKLTIKGDGALELFEAPKLIQNPNLEEFDTKVDLQLRPDGSATKIIDYTYLARGPVKIPAQELPLSYFDPETQRYMTTTLSVPAITVVGQGSISASSDSNQLQFNDGTASGNQKITDPQFNVEQEREYHLVGPIFAVNSSLYNSPIKWINMLLFLICFLVLGLIVKDRLAGIDAYKEEYNTLISQLKKSGLSYSALHKLINLLNNEKSSRSLEIILKESKLSEPAKAYFLGLLEECEKSTFKENSKATFVYKKDHFSELKSILKKKRKIDSPDEYNDTTQLST